MTRSTLTSVCGVPRSRLFLQHFAHPGQQLQQHSAHNLDHIASLNAVLYLERQVVGFIYCCSWSSLANSLVDCFPLLWSWDRFSLSILYLLKRRATFFGSRRVIMRPISTCLPPFQEQGPVNKNVWIQLLRLAPPFPTHHCCAGFPLIVLTRAVLVLCLERVFVVLCWHALICSFHYD